LITILRFLQGTSFAAELSGASLLIGESENDKKRFLGFSFLTSSTCLGAVFATGFVTILYKVFSKEQISSWAFRIPFIFVGLFGLLLFFFRYKLSETKEFLLVDKIENFSKILKEILKEKKKIFFSISSIIFTSNLITANIFFPQILSLCFKFEVSKIYEYTTYSLIFSVFAGPIFAHILSSFQKRKLMIRILLIYLITSLPSFYFLKNKNDFYLLFFLILQQIFISILYTCQISLIFETFPCNIRYTCKTFCNSIASFFSSFLPIIFNLLKLENKQYYMIYILIFLCFFSIKANYFLNKFKNEKFF
jgi:MHS family proline/betaine transporter-like MFS transporter